MSERRRPRHNPYQLPLDYDAQPLEIGQHVREIKEPHWYYKLGDADGVMRWQALY